MKKLLFIVAAIALLVACQSGNQSFGDVFTVKQPITIDELLSKAKTDSLLKDVQIEGKIDKSCMSEGCWFTIRDANNTEILFDVKDKKFRVPTNTAGKTAVILADVQKSPSSEQSIAIEVKGLMFK